MDRDPNRRPDTAGQLLDQLESALTSPNGSVGEGVRRRLLPPVIGGGGMGLSAVLVFTVGAAELVWLFKGSGLSLVTHAAHRMFGGG